MNEKDLDLGELSLEEIMKEFGSEDDFSVDLEDTQDLLSSISAIEEETAAEPAPVKAEPAHAQEAPQEKASSEAQEEASVAEPDEETAAQTGETPEEAPAETTRELPDVSKDADQEEMDDTVRLDDLSQITGTAPSFASSLDDKTERIGDVAAHIHDGDGDNGEEDDMVSIPAPIVFRPKQRLRELKRDLIAGPERRYYELSEKGVGKLQLAMLVCLLVVMASAAAALLYAGDMIPENRMRLMVFGQVLAMLIGALMGSHQMIEGVSDLFHGRFSLNMMLLITFLAGCADAYFCLQEQRVPLCAAFTLM